MYLSNEQQLLVTNRPVSAINYHDQFQMAKNTVENYVHSWCDNTFPSLIFTRKCSIQPQNLYSYLPYNLCTLKTIFSGYSTYLLFPSKPSQCNMGYTVKSYVMSVNIPEYSTWRFSCTILPYY